MYGKWKVGRELKWEIGERERERGKREGKRGERGKEGRERERGEREGIERGEKGEKEQRVNEIGVVVRNCKRETGRIET